MPTYEYQCRECGKTFARIMSMAEHDKARVTCPKCQGKRVRQVVSTFITKTSRKS